ncbi:toprim domain-containing protein [Candidatus Neomarinimicrobiota bacterium]
MGFEGIELYRRHIPDLRSATNGEWVGSCPYPACKDKRPPKFYVNGDTLRFHCKRCVRGNAIKFAKDFGEDYHPYCDIPQEAAVPDKALVERLHGNLLLNRGEWRSPWEEWVVRVLQVGWDSRLVFPVYDSERSLINIIWHKSHQIRGAKVSLYPLNLISNYLPDYVVVCEGLPDCTSLISSQIQAVTSTGGATGLPKDISPLKKFRRVYLCFDANGAGDSGVEKWIARLHADFPGITLRACDLTPFVQERGDVTDYLSLPGKNGGTFISEVLEHARVAQPYSDVPDFVRQKMLSDEFRCLAPRDRLVYQDIILRAARYRVVTSEINGQRIILQPGEYLTSLPLLAMICPPYTEKMLRTTLERLQISGFIRQRVLPERCGRVLTLVGWHLGQTKRQTDSLKMGRPKFPFSPSILPPVNQEIG